MSSNHMKEKIVSINSAYAYLRYNEYIHSGYRLNFSSSKRILRSLFMCHNESFNVWSHLIGLILFTLLLFQDLSLYALKDEPMNMFALARIGKAISESHSEMLIHGEDVGNSKNEINESFIKEIELNSDNLDNSFIQAESQEETLSKWPIFVYVLTAIVCMSMSSLYHLFNAYSKKANFFLSKLDYAGISVLIMGSYYPGIYYGFYCQPGYVVMYLTGISVPSLCIFAFSLMSWFSNKKMKWLRDSIFCGLGILGVVPLIHFWLFYDINLFWPSVQLLLLMAACYLAGVAVYIYKVPERFFPGAFDLWGNSHNIWHLFVLAGAVFNYFAALEGYYTRVETSCRLV